MFNLCKLTRIKILFLNYIALSLISINISQVSTISLNRNILIPTYRNKIINPFCYISINKLTHKPKQINYLQLNNQKEVQSQANEIWNSDELLNEENVYRGTLKNGLKYSFYKKNSPTFEAYLQICSGSADEKENQRGIAHLCEHVTYMGNNKRSRLNRYGVKSNAFTDYNHTVFYVKSDSDLGCSTKKEKLHKVLDTFLDVLKAPTQFNKYELDKERKAVLSEARIVTTADYYKNCNTVKVIHPENILPLRFPIGDLNMINKYTVDDLKTYHSQHYIPDNAQIFIQGDFYESDVVETIEEMFSSLENPENLHEIRALYKDTEKERRKGLPPVTHIYNTNGNKTIINRYNTEPVFDLWICDKLPLFSYEVLKKMPIPPVRTLSDYHDFILNMVVYKILNMNFAIFKRESQLYNNVKANDFDCINEGCRIRSVDIKCDASDWKNSVFYVLSEIKHFLTEPITKNILDYAKDSLLYDFETREDQPTGSIEFIENDICNRANLEKDQSVKYIKRSYDFIDSNSVSKRLNEMYGWFNGDLKGVKVLATSPTDGVFLDEVKEIFFKSLNSTIKYDPFKVDLPDKLLDDKHVEEIVSKSSNKIFGPMDKMFHDENFDIEKYSNSLPHDQKDHFREYYRNFKEYLELSKDVAVCEPVNNNRTPPEMETFLRKQLRCEGIDNENLPMVYNVLETNKPLVRSKPCDLYKSVPNTRDTTDNEDGMDTEANNTWNNEFEFYTLNNNVRVNCKRSDENSVYLSSNIPISEYIRYNLVSDLMSDNCNTESRIKTNKLMLLLITTSLMESGSMGDLDRKQVELFCELNSINVNITLNHDYLNISIHIPFKNSNPNTKAKSVEYSLQILNNLLDKHPITMDEFNRAKQKLQSDHQKYLKDIKSYGVGELVDNMTAGKVGFNGLEMNKLDEIDYETVLKEANKFLNSTLKEVNVVANIDLNRLREYVTRYLSTSSIHSENLNMPNELKRMDDGTEFHLKDYYRKNMVKLFDDVTDKAIVLVGGHAPNTSGFLPNGKHISTLLEDTLRVSAEDGEDIDKLGILRRELWMHPAFPKAASDLFSVFLSSDLFTNLRTVKNLTYDTNVDVVTNDISESFYMITTFSNNRNYSVILTEIINQLKKFANMDHQITKSYLNNCKESIKNKIKDQGAQYYSVNMSGIQLPQATTKNILSITEYEKVLDEITTEDFTLLLASNAFGIDPNNLYTRVFYSSSQ